MDFASVNFSQYVLIAAKALIIAVIGWFFAVVCKNITKKLVEKVEFVKERGNFSISVSKLVYYFILLITVVAVLEVIGLKYVTQPFIDLLNKVAGYLPNLLGAAIILVVGIFLANIAKEFTNSLLETFQIENIGKKYGIENLGGAIGNIVYLIILVFVVIAALNSLKIDAITKPAVSMLTVILNAIPSIIAAAVVFTIIFFLGKTFAGIIAKIVDDLNVDEIAKEIGITSDKFKFSELVRYLVITFAVLLGLTQAFYYLRAEALYDITHQFIMVMFKLIVAALIVFAGAYLGNLFEKRMENKNVGKCVKYAFIISAVFIALPYIGISPQVVEIIVFAISFGFAFAFALAFGLGGKETAAQILNKLMNSDKK